MADAATRAVAELVGGGLPVVAAIRVVGGGVLEDDSTSTAAAAALRAELPRRLAALPVPARLLYSFHVDVAVAGEPWGPARVTAAAFDMLAAAQTAVLYPRAKLFAPPLGLDPASDHLADSDPALDDRWLSPEFVAACDHIFGVCSSWAPPGGALVEGKGGGGDAGTWSDRQWAMFFRVVNGVSPTASEVGAFHREVDTLMALTTAAPAPLSPCDSNSSHHARSVSRKAVPMCVDRFRRWLVALAMAGQVDRCWCVLRAFG